MKIKPLLLLILLILLSFAKTTNAQGESNIWYFGDNAGLDFNSGVPIALTNGALYSYEGCAAISTSAGMLRFYTNGDTVWNNMHNPMSNGTGLLGHPSATQSGIIVPKPGSPNIYYVFTVDAAENGYSNGLRYSEVDMILSGGLGDVTANKNILLYTPVTEKLTAVKKANNIDFWVIVHDLTSTAFLVYSITSAGVNTTPLISNAGSIQSGTASGYLKASTDGSKLVQAIFSQTIDVLNFDNATGLIINDFSFNTPFNTPYGVEFSPDGTKLYVDYTGYPYIYQYNMTLGSSTAIIASSSVIGTSIYPAALQIASDGKIYLAKWGGTTLGCINNPNALGISCGYVDSAVNLSGKTSAGGLPNFVQTYFNPSITYINTCLGDTTYFSLADTTAIDSVSWDFNDPTSGVFNTSALLFSSHIFTSMGSYIVSAITHAGNIADTLTINFTISGTPVFTIGNDTILCIGANLALDPGAGYTSYLWQNLSTNQIDTVSAAGIYYVDVSNNCGTSSDTIHIAAPPIISVNDTSICTGQTANLTANGATSYSWSAGATSINTNMATATPAITTSYTVTGTTNACSSTDIATVIVNQVPLVNISPNVSIYTGAFASLFASGGTSYTWQPSENLSCTACSSPLASPLETTSYTVTVSDTNGCISYAIVKVDVTCSEIFVPSAFSPNNDGENDFECVYGKCVESISFMIFDRWGEMIFETTDKSNCWDGSYKGKPVDSGVFVYYLSVNLSSGESIIKKGNISLVK